MKNHIAFAFVFVIAAGLTPSFVVAQETPPKIEGKLKFRTLAWKSTCSRHSSSPVPVCSVPVATAAPLDLEVELAKVYHPGEADYAFKDFVMGEGDAAIAARLTIYSIFPHEGRGLPPYTQIRLDIAQPVAAFCSEAVRWRSPPDVPTLICGDYRNDGGPTFEQYGVTLFQIP